MKIREKSGLPSIEEKHPDLINQILKIVSFEGAADAKRQSSIVRSCTKLSSLHEMLQRKGIEISRSATYLRLIPRRSNTNEGKKHVKTCPVRMIRAQTSEHKAHVDTEFCIANVRAVKSIASFLGPDQAIYLSQDDKARVPIGITAAIKQQSVIMHMEYRIKLPDHTWVKAAKQKLIPSVYAELTIRPNGFGTPDSVTYSGPTIFRIKSGKHDSSIANSHAADIAYVLKSKLFEEICLTKTGMVKPVLIISTDGGPDENPRYHRVISHAAQHFKEYNLDALFLVTNAPGRSAFNEVERRMARLSQELSGLILDHEFYGTHLDS